MNPNLVAALTGFFPYLVPEMILGTAACVLFLGGTWRSNRHLWGGVALAALLAAGLALILNPLPHFTSASAADSVRYASPVLLDRLALLLRAVSIAGGVILVLFCWDAMPEKRAADYHACLLLMVAGMGLSGAANELVTLFLALELTSIPTYLILYIGKQAQPEGGIDEPAQEAAMKYFLLSVFSSALTLFGFSYLYGLAGTTNLPGLADAFRRASQLSLSMDTPTASPLLGMGMVALAMVVAGIGFRLTAVPFHFYAPDVYQGTTTANAAILAFVPKVAGFAALVRVLGFVVPTLSQDVFAAGLYRPILSDQLPVLLWIIAAVTMTLGNLLGLLQDNLRRLLAYSSVAHAGYMLIGLAAAPGLLGVTDPMVDGVDAVFFYLVAYGAMTIGAFAVLFYLSASGQRAETVDDLAGLSRTRPGMALVMVLFLFSLIGIPLTAGFMGKFLLFAGALEMPRGPKPSLWPPDPQTLFIGLALLAALNAAIGGWYYLRVAAVMYLREPPPSAASLAAKGQRSWPALAAVWLCAVLTLGIGVYPAPLKKAVQAAVPRLTDIASPEMAEQPAGPARDVLADAADREGKQLGDAMAPSPLDSDAAAVRLRYPSFCRQGTLTPLGNHGGFSGAVLWRIDGPADTVCLRAWPPQETWPRLLFRHRLMSIARQNGLFFVPTIFATVDSATAVEQAGRLWELTDWLPGRSDFHQHPSAPRLEAACTALAQLHTVWRSMPSTSAVCPAVQRRLTLLDEWRRLLHSGWHPLAIAENSDPLRPIVERAWAPLARAIEQVPRRLQRWLGGNPRVQPCLCDLWHDHFLFDGDRLTGLIDYGAVKVDHVAVDLARMLGSLVGGDAAGWQVGLQAYRRFAPLMQEEEELAHALDETGIVLGVANWLRWLYEEKRVFPDGTTVAHRLAELVTRLESLIM